jgi:PhnB protein
MSKVSIYLNFQGNAEEAFNFYKSIFRTEFAGPVSRMSDIPPTPGMPPLPDNEKNAIMHMALPILGGTLLQGTDMLESMGHKLKIGKTRPSVSNRIVRKRRTGCSRGCPPADRRC